MLGFDRYGDHTRLGIAVMLMTSLAGCTPTWTRADGPEFDGVAPGATGKCVVYIYYVSDHGQFTSPFYIDGKVLGYLEPDGYLRRELSCESHRFQIIYPSSFASRGVGMSAGPVFLHLREGSPAFLKVTERAEKTPIAPNDWLAPLRYSDGGLRVWSFSEPDQATALTELPRMRAMKKFLDSKP